MNKWKIWFKRIDENGKVYAAGIALEEYIHKSSAVRAAKRKFGTDPKKVEWIVSRTNPWDSGIKYVKDPVMAYLYKTLGNN